MSDPFNAEQRPNVRWENDFGPNRAMWKRYLLAAFCLAVVVGFLAFAILGSADISKGEGESPNLWIFAVVLGLVVVVALRGERWAIRVRHFFERRETRPEDLE